MRTLTMKKLIASVLAIVFAVVSLQIASVYNINISDTLVEAADADYPPVLMNFALMDNSKNLTASGGTDNSSCVTAAQSGAQTEQWRVDYCGADSKGYYFKIVNHASGRLLTPKGYNVSAGNEVVVYGNENDHSQYWYLYPVENDSHGNGLYYKIVNYKNDSMALTSGSKTTLSSYSGANNQKWLINSAGLQGFAGYCNNDNNGKVKASTIGGLLGPTVHVSNFNDLKKYATDTKAYTIVVDSNISVTNYSKDNTGRYVCPDGRIYISDNKTIIGSYGAHTLNDVQFCTKRNAKGALNGDNVIIKNFDMRHNQNVNGNDNIIVYFSDGQNLWVDHVTFTGHSDYNKANTGLVDNDKFLACCYNADYCTVSDCNFGLHEYGLILGYPDDTEDSYKNRNNFPRMSIMGNKFYKTLTRAPGLMRYGYFHSMNNYVDTFSMAYTVHSACKTFAENCYYISNGGNVIFDYNTVTHPGSYAEQGSTAIGCKSTTLGGGYATYCSWRPSGNYKYKALTADAAKNYTNAYSGCQSNKNNVNYITNAAAGVQSAGFMAGPGGGSNPSNPNPTNPSNPTTPSSPETMPHSAYFMISNANSGLFLEVKDGKAEPGANVQQWTADTAEPGAWNTWRFVPSDESGYYYIQSMLGSKNLVIDIEGGRTANGTNVLIYTFNGKNNQKFKIVKNSDGTYKIIPKSSEDKYVEVASASKVKGGNVGIWENTNNACQNWKLTEVGFGGEEMDTSVSYMFKNVYSGLYMEAKGAVDGDGTNVQQWEANGSGENKSGEWNSWHLVKATGDIYFIASNMPEGRYININGENAELKTYDKNVNTQMMRFVKNPDGTYLITPRTGYNKLISRYTTGLEIENASKVKGGNVRTWTLNGHDCQNWVIETAAAPVVTTPAVTTTVTTTTTTETTTTTTTTTAEATTQPTTTAATELTTTTDTKPTTTPRPVITTEVTTTTEPVTDPAPPQIFDLNGDNTMSISDLVFMQKFLLKQTELTPEQFELADMNKDGKVNVFDLIIFTRYVVWYNNGSFCE